jgi:molybdopterin-binding protein
MVSKIRCGSVESRIKTDLAGGSSSVFKKALAAWAIQPVGAAMMATLCSASVGLSWISRISSRIWSIVTTRDLDSGRAQWMSA